MIDDFFYDWNQSTRIDAASSDASGAARDARDIKADLTERLDKLTLISMAMWELLQEKAGLTETDLMARIKEIDLRDGQADGKVTRQIARCTKCDRVMSPRHSRCLYCGEEKLVTSAFDDVT